MGLDRIPYVIDNDQYKMADVLKSLLEKYQRRSLDVATAYFNVGGFQLLHEGLRQLSSFRLLLGAEPTTGEELGLRPQRESLGRLLTRDLEQSPFDEKTLRAVEDLIAFLRRNTVAVRLFEHGFLHAKCYLFYADKPEGAHAFERFKPVAGIVGSSNFTRPGLTTNRELNLVHKVLLDPEEGFDNEAQRAVSWLAEPSDAGWQSQRQADLADVNPRQSQLLKSEVGARAIIDLERWYDRQWQASRDFKEDLIRILDESKFGTKEYSPFEVYMKALYEYFRDEIAVEAPASTRSAVDLAEFQEDAVKKARRILMRYDGVMVADSVGLGKTWIGKKLLEDFAYHMRQKTLVVCPASLRQMWQAELRDAAIAAQIVSQEELGRDSFEPSRYADVDVILIDESHNFRNPNAGRYENMEWIVTGNGGRGREGARKKVILLTATPINNDLLDLYNQLRFITQNDKTFFSACGIGDLHRYFLRARRESHDGKGTACLFNLLEEVVIRRTRPLIRRAYPDATIRGKKIHFPDRRLKTVNYDLEATYAGIYDEVVSGIDKLNLAPYNLESYVKEGIEVDEMERGRETALVGIFKSRYLKRFESSIEAFRISISRALAFQKTFESYILDGRVLRSDDFQKAMRFLAREDEEDDATPRSLADELDTNDEARSALEGMAEIDPARYDLRKLHQAVQSDVDTLTALWQKVKQIGPERDAKLDTLKKLLAGELRDRKVLVFTYYKDTARYLYRELGDQKNERARAFMAQLGDVTIRRMDGGADAKERQRIVEEFAPRTNNRADIVGTEREIDILISTDVLSEGQNLQDCGTLVNFDLHWNPTRMVQRAGRVDRIGSDFDVLWLYNMFPDAGLERLLRLVQRLSQRISDIDKAGFLDASVLGETVHPQNFNTLRRIREEDGTVIEEEEEFTELASSEFLAQQLQDFMQTDGQERLDSLPDGIHSGLVKQNSRGIFFYFQGRPRNGDKAHFWRYYDLKTHEIIDNRYMIANYIQCEHSTPRVVDPEAFSQVFDVQERIVTDIMKSFQEQQALEAAPTIVDPAQQTVATALQGFLNHPDVKRPEVLQAIDFLRKPLMRVQIKVLRQAFQEFEVHSDVKGLLAQIQGLRTEQGGGPGDDARAGIRARLTRDDLRLICFDFLSGG